MNDLSRKEELETEEKAAASKKALFSNSLLQKKLENYLLLLYQGYLKGETEIETEIRTVFLSVVKQDEELAFKVRMLQLDYLNMENVALEGSWNEAADILFPEIGEVDKPIEESRKKMLLAYKETILEILGSSSELRS